MQMKLPEDCTGVSWRGEAHTPNERGYIDVPDEAALELMAHGAKVEDDIPPVPIKSADMSAKLAICRIPDMSDIEAISSFIEGEDRTSVTAAADARIAELKKPKEE
jgi:hypothetical protein